MYHVGIRCGGVEGVRYGYDVRWCRTCKMWCVRCGGVEGVCCGYEVWWGRRCKIWV